MLNQNIKNLRKQKGYTQETFAQELNVVRQTVSKWEKGYSVPDAVMLEKMAELLEISVSDLLGNAEEKTSDKTDLTQISAQLSVLNDQIAKELKRKRRNRKIALIILAVILAAALLISVFALLPGRQKSYIYANAVVSVDIDSELEKAISEAMLSDNSSQYFPGECKAESHFIFDTKEKDGTVTVYLFEDYREFAFRDGFFTDISGGRTPVVLTFMKKGSDYEFVKSEYTEYGNDYAPSVKRLFPRRIAAKILKGLSDEENELIRIIRVKQAQTYLNSIGRTAVICNYSDIKTEFLSDYGIATEVCNKITEMGLEYDSTVGNHERIENGKRYVYQTEYDAANDWITFTKFEYDTNIIVEFIAVDAATGEMVENAPKPEKVKYIKGELSSDTENQFSTVAYYE